MVNLRSNSGVSALPTILLISAIIVEVSIVSVVLATALNNTRFSERLGVEALSAARAGANDAMIRVTRFKDCPSTPECPSSYSLNVGIRSADITISNGAAGIITIQSTGRALTTEKSIRVILGIDPVTGEVALQSFREVVL